MGYSSQMGTRSNPIAGLRLPALMFALGLAACGGGTHQSPPPVQDFTLSVSPVSASSVSGTTSSAVTVSVTPTNGFTGAVNISVQNLPPGVDPLPKASFTIVPG